MAVVTKAKYSKYIERNFKFYEDLDSWSSEMSFIKVLHPYPMLLI